MTTQWHKNRMARHLCWGTFYGEVLWLQIQLEIQRKAATAVFPETESLQQQTTKALIADICANERRLKQ